MAGAALELSTGNAFPQMYAAREYLSAAAVHAGGVIYTAPRSRIQRGDEGALINNAWAYSKSLPTFRPSRSITMTPVRTMDGRTMFWTQDTLFYRGEKQ
jgi:hypothetical protein